MGYRDDIIKYIERIADREGLKPSTVCVRVAGQSGIYEKLKAGKDVTMTIAEKLRQAAQSRKKLATHLAELNADKIGN